MDNDRAFAAYAITLFAVIASALTASVLAGFATAPSPLVFLEHVALGLAIRASYKSIGGFDWADWSVFSDDMAAADTQAGPPSHPGVTADATT